MIGLQLNIRICFEAESNILGESRKRVERKGIGTREAGERVSLWDLAGEQKKALESGVVDLTLSLR